MIWIFWLLFIVAECLMHWYFIEVKHEDVTPDGKATFRHVIVIGLRLIVFVALLWTHHISFDLIGESFAIIISPYLEAIFLTIGATCLHLMIFGPMLNAMRGVPLHYLGKGLVDRFLNLTPSFVFRIWGLAVISAGMIYAYYNTDLL